MDLLRGTVKREELRWEKEMSEEGKEEETEDITKEEVIRHIKKLKMAKAPGEDGIENEAWRFMSKEMGEVFTKLVGGI